MTEEEKKLEQMIAECEARLEAFPDEAETLYRRGWAWYRKGGYDNAIADFNRILTGNADHADAIYMRGLALSKKGRHNAAMKDFSQAILRGVEQKCLPHSYYERGSCRVRQGALKDAIEDFNEAIRLDPQHTMAYVRRALAWQDLGEYHKAIADCNHAIGTDPESADAFHNRGNAWVSLGKLRKGIADFTHAIHLDPNSAASFNSRGIAWRRKGRYAKALSDFEKALELEPGSARRRLYLGAFLAICPSRSFRNGARALDLMTEACEITQYQDWECLCYLAAAHAELGDFESAIKNLQKSLTFASEQDSKMDIAFFLELYEAGMPWRMESPSFRDRWA